MSSTTDQALSPAAEIAELIRRSRAAQNAIEHYTQEQVDDLIRAMVWSVAPCFNNVRRDFFNQRDIGVQAFDNESINRLKIFTNGFEYRLEHAGRAFSRV